MAKLMSPHMLDALRRAQSGVPPLDGCRGRSQFAGRKATLWALMRRGLLDNDLGLTSAGRQHLERHRDAR